MANINLWTDVNFKGNKVSLVRELRKQAELLAESTDGLLLGEVNPVDTSSEGSDKGVFYKFYILAPYLANFRTLLFSVIDLGNRYEIFDPQVRGVTEASTMEELLTAIAQIIAADHNRELLSSLYANSLEIKTKRAS